MEEHGREPRPDPRVIPEKAAEDIFPPKSAVMAVHEAGKPTHMAGIITTSRTYKESRVVKKEEMDEERMEVRVFHGPVAEIGVDARMTINMGDFESVQVGVSVRLPCYVEELDAAYNAAKKFADVKLNDQVAAVKEYRTAKRKS